MCLENQNIFVCTKFGKMHHSVDIESKQDRKKNCFSLQDQGCRNVYGRPYWSGQSFGQNYIINIVLGTMKLIPTYSTGPDKVFKSGQSLKTFLHH